MSGIETLKPPATPEAPAADTGENELATVGSPKPKGEENENKNVDVLMDPETVVPIDSEEKKNVELAVREYLSGSKYKGESGKIRILGRIGPIYQQTFSCAFYYGSRPESLGRRADSRAVFLTVSGPGESEGGEWRITSANEDSL